ncbi:MAG TPA: GNAT family N-acetyltransferase [Kofleriaceae bacterium]|nr:GNAT family N-acetyltransferase [Kofleriaceae bacterium]
MRFVAPDTLTARPRTAADLEFLASLYASTRAAELAPVPWPDDAKRAFLRSQFDAQTHHYDLHYAEAEFLVLERDGQRIGRLILFWGDGDLRVVDIALVPECCGQGLGTALLRAVLAQATGSVSIHVERFNPALRLYQRLGFVHEEDTGVYYRMRWKGP